MKTPAPTPSLPLLTSVKSAAVKPAFAASVRFPVRVKPRRVRISCRLGRNGKPTFRRLARVLAHENAIENPPSFPLRSSVQHPCSSASSVVKTPARLVLACAALSAFAFLTTGCQILTYSSPNGERFTRSSIGNKTSIAHLSVTSSTNGMHKVDLKGYQDDSTEALGVITDAAIKAAISAAK